MPWRLLRSAAPDEERLGECGKRDEESSELMPARTAAKGRAEMEEGAEHGGRISGNPAEWENVRNRMQGAELIQGTWNCLRKELARKLRQKRAHTEARGHREKRSGAMEK